MIIFSHFAKDLVSRTWCDGQWQTGRCRMNATRKRDHMTSKSHVEVNGTETSPYYNARDAGQRQMKVSERGHVIGLRTSLHNGYE